MTLLATSFLSALALTFILIRSASAHGGLSADDDLSGPQKFHDHPIPRVGGIAIFLALVAGASVAQWFGSAGWPWLWLLIVTCIPAFASGLAEDLTKRVSPRRRLFFTAISAALGVWLLDVTISRTAIPGLDTLLLYAPASMILTVFAVTGVANSINIIDGFNGLASFCVVMMLIALAYVAWRVGDPFVLMAALVLAGAIMGFFLWNYPGGQIFLGDGGAYLIGILLAELSVALAHRNASVSPIFALMLCAYPIIETVFSIYRKKFLRGLSPGDPDGVHLHMLVYKRLIRWAGGSDSARYQVRRNSMTSPYLWTLCLLSIIPAVLWWDNTPMLAAFLVVFIASYVFLYWRIVRFRSPKWLVRRR